MNKPLLYLFILISINGFAQTGHIMQGAGAVNMSMGGAATGQAVDINGALLWNPAGISSFQSNIFSINVGTFFSSPELTSTLPPNMLYVGSPQVSGTTKDDRGVSIMPAISAVFAKENSKHSFGISAIGVSGFGVTFPQETNNPLSPGFDPTQPSNPINYPQQAGGFGHLESDYLMMQVGLTYSFAISEKFSIGIQPNFDYAALKLLPNPLASPSPTLGYPTSERASAVGFGAQVGIYFDSNSGFKAGASYKTPQNFGDFEFTNTYLDGSSAPGNNFRMDYPGIASIGIGYSTESLDIGLDGRQVFYESTKGFKDSGWTSTASVRGFGWKDMTIVSFGVQYKGIAKLPVRLGYTYSTNPVDEKLAFFSAPATAIIKHAFQVGLGYEISERAAINGLFHYGTSAGSTEGSIMNPQLSSPSDPYGEIPGSSVSYKMTTSLIMLGFNYNFGK